MTEKIQLYSNAGCPYAQRTRITLLEKKLSFDFEEIDLANKPDWFLKASPSGKVPVLVHRDHSLHESAIINEHIDEVWPLPALMPDDPGLRAQARIWIQRFSVFATTQFYIGIRTEENQLSELRQKLKGELRSIEEGFRIFSGDGPFWFGMNASLVDISFYTFFERMPMVEDKVGVMLADYPGIERWFNVMADRTSVRSTARTGAEHIATFKDLAQRMATR